MKTLESTSPTKWLTCMFKVCSCICIQFLDHMEISHISCASERLSLLMKTRTQIDYPHCGKFLIFSQLKYDLLPRNWALCRSKCKCSNITSLLRCPRRLNMVHNIYFTQLKLNNRWVKAKDLCLFGLMLDIPVINLQLCWEGSSWVVPVLSKD